MRMMMALASVSMVAIATVAAAQPAAAQEESVLGEVVVTARRKSESLQEVPQVVNAVSSDTLQKLNIQRFEEVQSVVPGLTLSAGSTGYSNTASVRGLQYEAESGAPPTVAAYLNDAPIDLGMLYQSLFDVAQIEVLKGPQGTTRGISAPSGAMTLSTRRPNLSEFGGYGSVTLTDLQGRNVNGAVNLPIISDVLAVRVAGIIDQNTGDGVRSLNNPLRPDSTTTAVRASVAFEPSDKFNAFVTYQHLDRDFSMFSQVTGPGAGYNGPAIVPGQRLSVQDEPRTVHLHQDFVTAQFDSRVLGQHLSYVGSYQFQKIAANSPQDAGNQIPDFELFQGQETSAEQTTHEIRLASDPAPGRFLDYTVGAFYSWMSADVDVRVPTIFAGFFGLPASPNPFTLNPRYLGSVAVTGPTYREETSFFGSLTAHLTPQTELVIGGRQIIARSVSQNVQTLLPAVTAARVPVPCALAGLQPSPYAGYCDVRIAGGVVGSAQARGMDRPFIYNVSLSHRFSRDFLAYANTGSSWRAGPNVIGITNGGSDPVLTALTFLRPETSRAYEVGFKSTLLDGRARLNVALFRQEFHNLIVRTEPVQYLANNGQTSNLSTFGFTAQGPAVIEGFDVESALQITPEWNVSLALSYADGHFKDATIPCNRPIPAGQAVRLCNSNGSTTRNPYWNAVFSTEYVRPVSNGVDGFARGLFTYYPENNRKSEALTVNPYSLLNLYAGLRSADGAWEVAVFAKNALKTSETLSRDLNPFRVSSNTLPISSGYFGTSFTPRREVGVSARYAFGSR